MPIYKTNSQVDDVYWEYLIIKHFQESVYVKTTFALLPSTATNPYIPVTTTISKVIFFTPKILAKKVKKKCLAQDKVDGNKRYPLTPPLSRPICVFCLLNIIEYSIIDPRGFDLATGNVYEVRGFFRSKVETRKPRANEEEKIERRKMKKVRVGEKRRKSNRGERAEEKTNLIENRCTMFVSRPCLILWIGRRKSISLCVKSSKWQVSQKDIMLCCYDEVEWKSF